MDYTGPSDEELVEEFRQIVLATDRAALVPLMGQIRDYAKAFPREVMGSKSHQTKRLTLINGGGGR